MSECQDCGCRINHRRSTAKYCEGCGLLRKLLWASATWTRAKRCGACGELYRPLHFHEKRLCGACADLAAKPPAGAARCTLDYQADANGPARSCRATVTHSYGVPVCLACLKSKRGRLKIIAALRRGQTERRSRERVTVAP